MSDIVINNDKKYEILEDSTSNYVFAQFRYNVKIGCTNYIYYYKVFSSI